MKALSATQAAEWLTTEQDASKRPVLLDVREPWEVEVAHVTNSTHIPMGQIPARLAELDPQRPIICLCHHGVRSARVALFLKHHGFENVYNLTGGIDAWSLDVDPSVAMY